jgi:hypothetical protein
MTNKFKLLQIFLIFGVLYCLIGGFAHFFGLTIFPFFDANLYTSYQDSLIALMALILALFLLAIARDPVRNKDTLKIAIISTVLSSIFNITILWKVNFANLGAPGKETQIIVEGIIGFIYAAFLLWLYPKESNNS